MIVIDNLYFKYNKSQDYVLNDISATFEPGIVHILLGLNGSGKTTLFDIISGILYKKVNKGTIQGVDFKKTMYMTQGILFPTNLKGEDLIKLYLKGDHRGTRENYENYTDLFAEKFKRKIQTLSKIYFGNMSVGQRRWLTFSLAMLLNRKIYLFDEPTSGIDPHSRIDILEGIIELSKSKDKVVIMSTHVLHDLQDMDCKFHLLHNGRMAYVGTFDNFICKYGNSNPDKAFRNFVNNYQKENLNAF